MRNFIGTGVALVTPFDKDGKIDRKALKRLVAYTIDGGVDFLVVLGTTAETPVLSVVEKAEIVEIVVAENKGRLPIMVGVGGNNTQEAVRDLKEIPWLKKCDGILSVVPYYNKPSQRGIYEHFKAIAESSPLPVCLYNIPGRSGVNMSAATTLRLSRECPNICAIKEASGNFEQATEILKDRRNDFAVFSGDDGLGLPLMSMGSDGVISVIANAFPKEYSTMVNSIRKGDYDTARQIHFQLSEMCCALFAEGNPAGIKAVLHVKGLIAENKLRLPLVSVSDSLYSHIRELCRTLN